MSALRDSAINLIKEVPEDKLYYIVQIISGINNLYGTHNNSKETAFINLESLRQSAPDIDYESELNKYREEKYGIQDFD